ncbi:biotin-dependent carboxylase-like uncharacterized protein [Maritalea mobilis]|uniref:Biotin-dependent carboxylase-like uncharacterized protein n=1 Tax=Maritalea mobilis TaxID=483324 RepID=A0A4R6VU98_9HYPH|nr:biotin-dependent carboxyltransferase family protein [Maritalea mobilis]TDQ66296.1 biotin-dependent carboxylase-like uncharacterized protein [Maritalea mobilis]
MNKIVLQRVSPHSTVQDEGRIVGLKYGVSASGPMDRQSFAHTLALLGQGASSALEFTMLGLKFTYHGQSMPMAAAGGAFSCTINGQPQSWPLSTQLNDGDVVDVTTGHSGMYGYVRFNDELNVPTLLGSKATNLAAHIGGLDGRALKTGDQIELVTSDSIEQTAQSISPIETEDEAVNEVTLRILPGLHADLLGREAWQSLFEAPFSISSSTDRMGLRLNDPEHRFAKIDKLRLVSDAVVPGDIQILGEGTPVILMRDHQPTGGYPRIATLIDKDLDRAAQLRPNTRIRFQSITLEKAHQLL